MKMNVWETIINVLFRFDTSMYLFKLFLDHSFMLISSYFIWRRYSDRLIEMFLFRCFIIIIEYHTIYNYSESLYSITFNVYTYVIYGLSLYLQNTRVHFIVTKQFIDAEGRIKMSFKSTHQTKRKTGKSK